MRIKFRREAGFRKVLCEETSAALHNPGCGWYHIYTFTLQPSGEKEPVEARIWMDEAAKEEQLALVLIDIGAFRAGRITQEALLYVQEILDFFHGSGKQMLLRFVYDREGKGLVKEPLTLSVVKQHMEQLGEIVRKYMEDILVMQGVFIGNWGEMHGSKFLDDRSLCELVNTLYRVTEGACFLAVRTPAQWRRVVNGRGTPAGVRERLALFNDGMFGSSDDLGTYGTRNRAQAGETGSWCRKEELEWQKEQLAFVPNGGEAVAKEAPAGCGQEADGEASVDCLQEADSELPIGCLHAAEEMCSMHTCYLNSVYHPARLEHWKRETIEEAGCWNGLSGYDYIGRHLGYRFVVRNVTEGRGKELYVTIENCGFGNLCQEADCFLEVEEGGTVSVSRRLDTDPRQWRSRETVLLRTGFFLKEKHVAGSGVYLALRRRADGRAVVFANHGAGERLQIGKFLDLQKA